MSLQLTIAIPTYLREQVLVNTCTEVISAMDAATMELLIIDQTPEHEPSVQLQLSRLEAAGELRRIVLDKPSLTKARNTALLAGLGDIVLFLDDDVRVPEFLFRNHLRWFDNPDIAAVTGEVYNCRNPENPPLLHSPAQGTYRHSGKDLPEPARNTSGGNHSVRKTVALEIGGYDERFVGSALTEDLDFAQRLISTGAKIWYDPEAWIIHLGIKSGGCGVSGSRIWPEWMHSANIMLYTFRHSRRQRNFYQMLWMALRNGPLRKENIKNPLRWPVAIWGFIRGSVYGWNNRCLPDKLHQG